MTLDHSSEKRIIAMSLVSSAMDREQDVLEYISPLMKRAVGELTRADGVTQISTIQIQEKIKELYDVQIPLNTLLTLARRGEKRKEYRTFENGKYLQVDGKFRTDSDILSEERLRRFNSLAAKYRAFAAKHGILMEIRDAAKLLVDVFQTNGIAVSTLLTGDPIDQTLTIRNSVPEIHRIPLPEFLKEVTKSDQEAYNSLHELYSSTALLAVLEANEPSLDNLGLASKARIYLDTNFLLRILDFQTEFEHTASIELLNILHSRKTETHIFSFTLDETFRTLEHSAQNAYEILNGPLRSGLTESNLNGVVAAIQRRGLTRSDFERLLDNLDQEVLKLGIGTITTGRLSSLKLDQSVVDALVKLKSESPFKIDLPKEVLEAEARHDIAAMTEVRRIRKGEVFKFKEAKAWFLTCDSRLYRFNLDRHKDSRSVTEAILDGRLTDLLWIMSPLKMAKVGADQLIATMSTVGTFDTAFLRRLTNYVNRYMNENPESLPYADEIFRGFRIQDKREALLRLQREPDLSKQTMVFQEEIDRAIATKRSDDERLIEQNVGLASILKDLRDEVKAVKLSDGNMITTLRNENLALSSEITKEREENREKEKKIVEDRSKFRARIALIISIAISTAAMVFFVSNSYSIWWRLTSLIPVIAFYVYYETLDPRPKDRVLRIFGTVFYVSLTLLHIVSVLVHAAER